MRTRINVWHVLLVMIVLSLGTFGVLAEETATHTSFFDNDAINRMIDENYKLVQENGYAELRIPRSLHGITEEALTPNSLEVGRKLIEHGCEAYAIGGCIRDYIMGTESNDVDIATNATIEQQREIFGDDLYLHFPGGMTFGRVRFPDEEVDLASYQTPSLAFYGLAGMPEFDPTATGNDSVLLDSFQRDLTMNAIYYDLTNGDLVDFHGGLYAIREHVIDTIVPAANAVNQDGRKLIRALRFKSRFGYELSDSLDRAIRKYGVAVVNRMRQADISNNINKMMEAGYASKSWRNLADYGLLDTVFPSLIRLVNDADYLNYLDKATAYMDDLHNEKGRKISDTLILLTFIQPEIDRRAQRSAYLTALSGVLDEQEMTFKISAQMRERLEGISVLAHDMEKISSQFLKSAVQESEYYEDALALLNMKALTNSELTTQAAFWNENADKTQESLDKAA